MSDEPIAEVTEEESPKGMSTGKKVGLGCGCGCLVVILLIAGVIYWGYSRVSAFANEYKDQGYSMVEVQTTVIKADEVVQGPIFYFGQAVTIDGTIEGDVAAMCQSLTINGTINGNLDLLCQAVTITETGVITGNVTCDMVQLLTVDGTVEGEITGTMQVQE